MIEVNPAATDGVVGVMRHEIVHTLRDPALWDSPFGLFTRAEWLRLVAEAKSDTVITDRMASKYADKSQDVRNEEAVAETCRLWAQGRELAGPLARAFAKVKAYLQAVANRLRGQGFLSSALTMERIASGTIGGGGPDGGGSISGRGADSRDVSLWQDAMRRFLQERWSEVPRPPLAYPAPLCRPEVWYF
ncbi:MAG: hypothetical protein WCO04_06885 [Pseudomonadota bacterium]